MSEKRERNRRWNFGLTGSGPQLLAEFTHPCFYRITTHVVFRHRGRTLLGVSGYPGTVFLIDAEAMGLPRTVEMEQKDAVDLSGGPHFCRQDAYGIVPSTDGEAILAVGTGFVRVATVANGRVVADAGFADEGSDWSFTGHLCPVRASSASHKM